MHDGCSASFSSGKEVVDKIRMMGFDKQLMPIPLIIICKNCSSEFEMTTYEYTCPKCGMVHGVTPCHAFDPENVQASGIEY